jgi:AsmA protein
MAKLFKILGIVFGALAVLVVLAALILPRVVNPNAYKTEIAELVRAKTGRTLSFGGDLSLSVFPWLGVRTGALSLSNAPGFGDAPFAAVQETDVRVRLLPLISRELEVATVVVRGLRLNLARNPQGKGNWEDLAGARAAAPQDIKEEDLGGGKAKPDGGPRIAALAVGGIKVEKAAITWDDRAAGQKAALGDLDLTTGELALGKPVDISFSTSLESSTPKLAGTVRLKARAEYAPGAKKSALSGLALDIDLAGEGLPGGKLAASLAADLAMDYATHRLDVANLRLKALGLDLSGKAGVDMSAVPTLAADLSLAECNPRSVLAALGLAAPALADDKALTRLAATLSLTATTLRADISSLKLTLDDATLTGAAGSEDFSRPAARFALAADTLDLDRYLPSGEKAPAKEEKKTEKKPAPDKDGKAGKEEGLPRDRLRALLLDGALQVGSLTIYGARLTDVRVTVTAKDGVLKVSPLTAALYGGRLKTDLVADLRKDLARTTLGLDLSDMLLGGLLKDVLGEEKATGTTRLTLDLAADGEDAKALARSLDGVASFALRNGVLKGFSVIPQAVRSQAAAGDPQKRVDTAEKQQEFSDITASFTIKDGVARTRDLLFNADHLKVTGGGLADLGKQAVDYTIKADITGAPTIPFTVRGPFDNISASLDAAEFAKGLARGVVNLPGAVGKGALDVGKGALEGIGQGLGSIFGGQKKDEKKP